MITIQDDQYQTIINQVYNGELGTVLLYPTATQGGDDPLHPPAPPDILPPPAVMTDFAFVPSPNYIFKFSESRYLRLGYVLERDDLFEAGEIHVLTNAQPVQASTDAEDPLAPPSPPAPLSWTLWCSRYVLCPSTVPICGVELVVLATPHDVEPTFGLAFKITSSTPAVYPTLRAFWLKKIGLES